MHSPNQNLYYIKQENTRLFDELIDKFELIVNHNKDFATRAASQRILIIDLALNKKNLKLFIL